MDQIPQETIDMYNWDDEVAITNQSFIEQILYSFHNHGYYDEDRYLNFLVWVDRIMITM